MMMLISKTALVAAAAFAIGLPIHAGMPQQGAFTVDENMAKRGKQVWERKGCFGCHQIGKPLAGPDLMGVHERRSLDWLRRWLKNTNEMLQTDSIAQAMLAEAKNQKMPQQNLSDADIDALIHYIARETNKRRGG